MALCEVTFRLLKHGFTIVARSNFNPLLIMINIVYIVALNMLLFGYIYQQKMCGQLSVTKLLGLLL